MTAWSCRPRSGPCVRPCAGGATPASPSTVLDAARRHRVHLVLAASHPPVVFADPAMGAALRREEQVAAVLDARREDETRRLLDAFGDARDRGAGLQGHGPGAYGLCRALPSTANRCRPVGRSREPRWRRPRARRVRLAPSSRARAGDVRGAASLRETGQSDGCRCSSTCIGGLRILACSPTCSRSASSTAAR